MIIVTLFALYSTFQVGATKQSSFWLCLCLLCEICLTVFIHAIHVFLYALFDYLLQISPSSLWRFHFAPFFFPLDKH